MLKNISRLEHTIKDKFYHFTCDSDASLDDVKEALFQFQKYVGKIEDQFKAMALQKQQNVTPEVKEEPKPE